MKKIIFVIILLFIQKNVYSENLFDTSLFNIEFTSSNIDNDKIELIKKIKYESVLSIFKKILNEEDYIKINDNLTEDIINTFVKNIVINDEKIINNKYFSNIKINFHKNKIVEFLRFNKLPYVEYHPDKFLLIIYEQKEIGNNLFTRNNNYYKYFISNLKDNNFFKIPNLDINDRFILKGEDILNKNLFKINKFSKKYNSSENLVVISKINKNKKNYELILYSDGFISEKKFQYNENEMKLFFEILQNETLNLWKKLNQIQNYNINILNCKIYYFNLLELKEIRKNLNNISAIKYLNIKNLEYKNIEYDIHYYGNIKILFKILELNKLKINYSENSCIIRLK